MEERTFEFVGTKEPSLNPGRSVGGLKVCKSFPELAFLGHANLFRSPGTLWLNLVPLACRIR